MSQAPRTVVISGGAGGVGSATAALFVKAGWRVGVLYRTKTNTLAKMQRDLGSAAHFIQVDVSDNNTVEAALQEIVCIFGRIDACIHAAVDDIVRKQITEMTPEEFHKHFTAGFFGAFTLFRSAAANMNMHKSGTLIGITSSAIEEEKGGARMGAYTIAKFALRALLRELHTELSPKGIRVYAVAPDLMQTELTSDLPQKYFEFADAMKKLTSPDTVAQTLLRICTGDLPSGVSVRVSSGETRVL